MKPQSDLKYENLILELLHTRDSGKTICPSEILNGSDKQNPKVMEAVREAAQQLVKQNKIEIVQQGRVVDPNSLRGPIRLRLKQPKIP